MLIACLGYAAYTVALRERPPITPRPFFLGLAVVALISSLPLVGIEIAHGTAQMPDLRGWLIILYVAVLPASSPSSFSCAAWSSSVPAAPACGSISCGLVSDPRPLILGEVFAWYHAVALTLVLGGIAIAESGKR